MSKSLACVARFGGPGGCRLPCVGASERSLVLDIPGDLHAEVGQVEMHDIDAALVPVEQTDPTVVSDTQIRWPRIAVDDRGRQFRHRREHREHDSGGAVRERRHVGVDTSRRPVEFGDHLTAGSAQMTAGPNTPSHAIDSKP